MTSNTLVHSASNHTKSNVKKSGRLYYLDWLRVILIFGVFLVHAVHPFDALIPWYIKNAEQNSAVTAFLLLTNPWGIPLFFLVAGAGSKFALSRRSNKQYISERVNRLLIPFVVGSLLLSPLQAYLEALHKGSFQGSFLSYLPEMLVERTSGNLFTPLVFSRWGFHLYFLAFLFAYSILALPIFRWFKRDGGQSLIIWLGRLVEKRGGILLFVIPLALARILVQAIPEGSGWLNFTYYFFFFVLGYIIYSDDRFVYAVRRDRWLLFVSGVIGLVVYGGLSAVFGDQAFEWALTFVVPWSIILIFVFVLMSWGWALNVLYLAMKYLNFSNKWLVYGSELIMPFYLLHQPVIIVIAYFTVQWDVGVLPKLLVIVIGSFLITLGLVELLVRPFKPMRRLFGMKPRKRNDEEAKTAVA
ncbi:MAG: acyltransferase family protein [Chloroflexi bacterium]|nr:acyltransferase family protein [Chloroflexota bacterium]